MTKNGFVFIIVIILIIVGIIFFTKKDSTVIVPENDESQTVVDQMMSTSTDRVMGTTTDSMDTSASTTTSGMMSDKSPKVITYTETGFSPDNLTIKSGDTTIFQNDSARAFWPASNDHPVHYKYSEFDPKKIIPAGESWSFTFTKSGTWGYHDHRSSNLGGTITVQ